jgi:hypothetical protein
MDVWNDLQEQRRHQERLEFEHQEEGKRLQFQTEQEQKRLEFERRLESKKAIRDWLMLVITLAAVGAAFWTGYEGYRSRLDAIAATQLDQRPFLTASLSGVTVQPDLQDSLFIIETKLTSFGRTPAVHVI